MKCTQWAGKEDNEWQPTGPTVPKLDPGFYKLSPGGLMRPWSLNLHEIKHDTIISTGLAKDMASDIDTFLQKRDHYRKFGFLHKRGYLLAGAPGVGKTMTAFLLCHHVISHGGIAVTIPSPNFLKFLAFALQSIREVQPNVPIINLMEDLELHFATDPRTLLNILDGENQVDNIVHIATTNFPSQLDARLLNRPGRFDRVVTVGPPDAATRRSYLQAILPSDSLNMLDEMVAKTDGFMLSHLHGLIAGALVQEQPIDTVIAQLRAMNKTPTSSSSNREVQASALYSLAEMISSMASTVESMPSATTPASENDANDLDDDDPTTEAVA